MPSIRITSDGAPRVQVLTCSAGPFLSIEHGEDVSVLVQPAGFGAEQVAYARSMAAQLTAAADEIETKLGAAANV